MKTILINRLTLENFKCHSHLTLAPEGKSISIYGDNATGKTSIYDALTWLLFGKDSLGNSEKHIDFKPLNEKGQVRDRHAITAVEASLTVDGRELTLRRTLRENWTKRRGTAAAVYEGNTCDYFVDGICVKKNAFDTAIRELVSEDRFRMLTSVSHFASAMKWQDRRAVLFDMAGTLTDQEVMAKDPRFTLLAKQLGGQTLSACREKLNRKKKDLTGIREETPARLNECQRLLRDLEDLDFAAAREEEQVLLARKQAIRADILQLVRSTAPEKLQLQLDQLQLQRRQLEAKNLAHRESQRRGEETAAALRRELTREQAALNKNLHALTQGEAAAKALEEELSALRREWITVNGEAFAQGKCPTCGQALPFEQLQTATEAFNRRKEERLAAITAKLQNRRAALDYENNRLCQLREEMDQAQQRIQTQQAQLNAMEAEAPAVTDLPGFREELACLENAMDKLRKEIRLQDADCAGAKEALEAKQKAVEDRLRLLGEMLGKQTLKTQTEQRMAVLRADAQAAEEKLAEIEKMLDTIQEFTRFKAKFVEESINSLFSLAAFRLFREQANGGLEERCDAQVEGIPYPGLNNAMKVNVGIDIINALSRHYGVQVPLFIDNAEAVTHLEQTPAQVIRLVVSPGDNVLRTE